jgi:Xaa-Pro aminopeptidase
MIKLKEYQARRKALAMHMSPGSIAVIPAKNELLRNGDAHYRFRQDSDFYYLTGFDEPDALLLITSGEKTQSILFNRPRERLSEQWTGRRLGQEDALSVLGVNEAYSLSCLDERLPEILAGRTTLFYTLGRYPTWDTHILQAWQKVKDQVRKGIIAPDTLCDLLPMMGEMRLFKSEAEIALMKQAAKVTVAAHQRAMRSAQSATYEYELEAELLYEFTRQGCRSVAYDSIVAAGDNACVLHYTANNQALKNEQLILIDAGGEYQNYAADVTRTFPHNGTFSVEQRLIYELVLNAQKAGISCVKPGCPWNEIQQTMLKVLTTGVVDLGLLHGNTDDLIATKAYSEFYMHNSGHWLGLDVHDVGLYKINDRWRALEAGMVLTVEPGIYIPSDAQHIAPKWRGIGVRIEDDILVTPNGHENLTKDLAVETYDVEALVCG